MKDTSENYTLLFLMVYLFCILCTVSTYLGMKPEAIAPADNIVIFPHPEDAS